MDSEPKTMTIPLWDCPELEHGKDYLVTVGNHVTGERSPVHLFGSCVRGVLVYRYIAFPKDSFVVAWMLAPSIPPYDGPAREVRNGQE